jgi:hypothetical protein
VIVYLIFYSNKIITIQMLYMSSIIIIVIINIDQGEVMAMGLGWRGEEGWT